MTAMRSPRTTAFGLVVRHVDGRDARVLDDAAQVVAQAQAQLGVEVGQRLVEQEQLRVVDEAARQRDRAASARPRAP
jgi:hypothetical protein